MRFTTLLKVSLALGAIPAVVTGELRAVVLGVPLALTLVSLAGLIYLMLTPPRR